MVKEKIFTWIFYYLSEFKVMTVWSKQDQKGHQLAEPVSLLD